MGHFLPQFKYFFPVEMTYLFCWKGVAAIYGKTEHTGGMMCHNLSGEEVTKTSQPGQT